MKLVGYRHKDSKDCVWLAPTQDAADRMIKAWMDRTGTKIPWSEHLKHFEPIEADLEYEDSTK